MPLAEEGWCDPQDEIVRLIALRYLEEMQDHGIDTMVLGCTHYPLLKGVIQKVMGDSVTLIDSAEETAREVKKLLEENGLLQAPTVNGTCSFFVTDIPHRFIETGKLFLGKEIETVQLIDIL